MADSTTALEPTTGTLAVDYTVYLTAAAAQTSTVDYSVTGSGPNNLGTADIVGGTGSGVVQIAAGQTSAQIVVDVLANALGSLPDAELQVGVTATGGETLFGSSARDRDRQSDADRRQPGRGADRAIGRRRHSDRRRHQHVLNLGTQVQNGPAPFANLGIENGATVPADDLFPALPSAATAPSRTPASPTRSWHPGRWCPWPPGFPPVRPTPRHRSC